MAYDGYLALDGHEIINSERFAAYSSSLVPMLSVRNCYPCSGLPNVINRPTSALTRAQILRASAYRTPCSTAPSGSTRTTLTRGASSASIPCQSLASMTRRSPLVSSSRPWTGLR